MTFFSLPGPSCGPSLPPETVTIVWNFYESDEISHVMPGKKDFVSVKKEGNVSIFKSAWFIGVARGGHGRAFALPSLNFALPSNLPSI